MEHFAQWIREVWPFRNLSESEGGATGDVVARVAGTGVGERWKGLLEDTEVDEIVLSLLSVLDCRDLRRNGAVGWRYCGKTDGMESECRRKKDILCSGSHMRFAIYINTTISGPSASAVISEP